MKRNVTIVLVIAVLAAIGLVFFLFTKNEDGRIGLDKAPAGGAYKQADERAGIKASNDPTGAKPAVSGGSGRRAGELPRLDQAGRRARAESLKAIIAALASKGITKQKARSIAIDGKDATPTEKELLEYVRDSMKEIRPLLRGCYQREMEHNKNLAGMVKVKFSIVADEEYGGLVESSGIAEGGNEDVRKTLGECLRETMYALRFKKPLGAGRVTVTYPLIFSNGVAKAPTIRRIDRMPKLEVEGFE